MNNPYQPPASDTPINRTAPQRPSNVKIALSLYVLTIFLGVIGVFAVASGKNFTSYTGYILFIILAFYLTGAYLVWDGRNWARIIGVLYLVVDIASRISLGLKFYGSNHLALSTLVSLIALLDIAIIILLVNKKTSAWLKDLKTFRSGRF
jgi:hypothetical protein